MNPLNRPRFRLVLLGNDTYVAQFKQYGVWYHPRKYRLGINWCQVQLKGTDYEYDGSDTAMEALKKLLTFFKDKEDKKALEGAQEFQATILKTWPTLEKMKNEIQ